jgi:1-acyl-sn-glycerol-3-phosphate acyltransferase
MIGLAGRRRQTLRLMLIGLWTVICYLVWLPVALLSLPFGRWARQWNELGVRVWTGGLVRAMGIQVDVSGTPPAKPFFLVSNHLSYVDILVLGSRLGPTFISKYELGDWPVLGHLARVTGTIFVNRERKRDALRVIREIDQTVSRGGGVVLFPEGTSTRGDRIYPLKSALLEWAAQRGFPVHAATIRYETGLPEDPAVQSVCWWGDMTFGPHILRLLTLPRIRATIAFAPAPVVEHQRGALAAGLQATLEQIFTPIPAVEGA